MSPLVILGLFVNTLTVDDEYFLCNSENLKHPIQMQLSEKQKTFSLHFAALLKFKFNAKYFGKTDKPYSLCISELPDCKRRGYANV